MQVLARGDLPLPARGHVPTAQQLQPAVELARRRRLRLNAISID